LYGSGDANDIIHCFDPTFGSSSTCATVSLLLNLSELGNRRIDGLHVNELPTAPVATNRAEDITDTTPAFLGDDVAEADPDEEESAAEQDEALRLFLPLVNR
ncbi:MAG: hypothetical protein M3Q45_09780, partial [Chloroflexota bacterium]|nr:hypothetical protein [Chloroflexota bacterium]